MNLECITNTKQSLTMLMNGQMLRSYSAQCSFLILSIPENHSSQLIVREFMNVSILSFMNLLVLWFIFLCYLIMIYVFVCLVSSIGCRCRADSWIHCVFDCVCIKYDSAFVVRCIFSWNGMGHGTVDVIVEWQNTIRD